jgi:hypothetical protein
MKKYVFILIICLIMLTGCGTSSFVYHYNDPVQHSYVSTNYYDYSTGVSIVYINSIPYYQYYNSYKKYWYRKPVPRNKYVYIKRKPHINNHSFNHPHKYKDYNKRHNGNNINNRNNRNNYKNNTRRGR